jgi:hypothetical protein
MTEADIRKGMPPVKVSREAFGKFDDKSEYRKQVQDTARALGHAVRPARSRQLRQPGAGLSDPNPK